MLLSVPNVPFFPCHLLRLSSFPLLLSPSLAPPLSSPRHRSASHSISLSPSPGLTFSFMFVSHAADSFVTPSLFSRSKPIMVHKDTSDRVTLPPSVPISLRGRRARFLYRGPSGLRLIGKEVNDVVIPFSHDLGC